jgi:spermidine synthase
MMAPRFKYRYFSFLFLLSGFAGIIYESVWVHYAKILTGHAAFAQSFLLVIFLAGMAAGAFWGGKIAGKHKRLFLFYAGAEALIGLFALLYHPIFEAIKHLLFQGIYPNFAPAFAETLKWLMLFLLTFPATVMMGATFPLLAVALQRNMPGQNGRLVSQLYFTNSMGAAAGILFAAWILIPEKGLHFTVVAAGIFNILVAMLAILFIGNKNDEILTKSKTRIPTRKNTPLGRFLIVAALITGAASFIYQIAWIRMLSMVLGSSIQSFELMLSAFIFGLAIGAWIIRRKIDRLKNPVAMLLVVQVVMGLLAMLSPLVYNNTFYLMEWLLAMLTRDAAGYTLFNLSGQAIAFLVMLPATICAGMALPLMIKLMQTENNSGESIGNIYAADTAGGIIGVLLAFHLLLPLAGLKFTLIIAGAMDVLLGLFFFRYLKKAAGKPLKLLGWSSMAVILFTLVFVSPDPLKMASGVFRYGGINETNTMLFHRDGKTATIAVYQTTGGSKVLTTNGKPDASINDFGRVSGDEATQILLAALPASIQPKTKDVAVIGLGSGVTAHVALTNPNINKLDVIEIEPVVADAAPFFLPHNENIFTDSRYRLHMADARTFLSQPNAKYDLIISEPSNPWVSGMASLFTKEFYQIVNIALRDEGMFVQWLHTYEMSIPLVASVIKALSPFFNDYHLYFLDDGDVVIIGKKGGLLSYPSQEVFSFASKELERLGIATPSDLRIRRIGGKSNLDTFFKSYIHPANSDYFPFLEYEAPAARFMQLNANGLLELVTYPLPMPLQKNKKPLIDMESLSSDPTFALSGKYKTAPHFYLSIMKEANGEFFDKPPVDAYHALIIRNIKEILKEENRYFSGESWQMYLWPFHGATMPFLSPEKNVALWETLSGSSHFEHLPEKVKIEALLFQAVANADFDAILKFSEHILENPKIYSESLLDYATAARLCASIELEDENVEVSEIKNRLQKEDNVVMRYLISVLDGKD